MRWPFSSPADFLGRLIIISLCSRKSQEAKKERKRKIKLARKEQQDPLVGGHEEDLAALMQDDPYFAEAFDPEEFPDFAAPADKVKKKRKNGKKEHKEETLEEQKKKAQLELLMLDEGGDAKKTVKAGYSLQGTFCKHLL